MVETPSSGLVSLRGRGKEHAGLAPTSAGWSTDPHTERLRVRLLFEARAQAAGWVPAWGYTGGNLEVSHVDASLFLSPPFFL